MGLLYLLFFFIWLQSKSLQLQGTRYVCVVNNSCFVKKHFGSISIQLGQGVKHQEDVLYRVTVHGLFLAKRLISVRHSLMPVATDIRPPLHPQRHATMICHGFLQNHCQKCEQHL
jgi:hypothetical protein